MWVAFNKQDFPNYPSAISIMYPEGKSGSPPPALPFPELGRDCPKAKDRQRPLNPRLPHRLLVESEPANEVL